jgi:hypothetical protein
MATAELAVVAGASPQRRYAPARARELRPVALAAAALLATGTLGALLALLDGSLIDFPAPHPTLHPTLGAIASIFANNLRALAVPFILIAFRFPSSRPSRIAGDALVAGLLLANGVQVGFAIGRWQGRLVPYLPHLPLEYLAASVAAGAWLSGRRSQPLATTVRYGALTVALLGAAAVVEVLLTPHAH